MVVVGIEIHGAAAAAVVAAIGAWIVVAVCAVAVPSRRDGVVVVGVEIVAMREGYGVGRGEGVGETEAFAVGADEEDLVGLCRLEVGEQRLTAVAGHDVPVVAIAVFDSVVRVIVLSAPGDAAGRGAVDGAVQPRGVGIVGEGETRKPYPAAARSAAGADGQAVEVGTATAELDVELLQLVGLSVAEGSHLDKRVGVGGVGKGTEVEIDIVVVGSGEIGVDPFAAQRVAGGQRTEEDGVVVVGAGVEGHNLLAVLGLGERIGVATAHHLPVVGEYARGEVLEVLAVGRVEHGVEGVGHRGAEGHIGVAALRHDVEVVVAVGVDARNRAGTVCGGDDGGRVGAVGAVIALAAVFDIDGGGVVQCCPADLHGSGRGGELDIGDAAAAHINVVDIVNITCIDRFKAESDILP